MEASKAVDSLSGIVIDDLLLNAQDVEEASMRCCYLAHYWVGDSEKLIAAFRTSIAACSEAVAHSDRATVWNSTSQAEHARGAHGRLCSCSSDPWLPMTNIIADQR